MASGQRPIYPAFLVFTLYLPILWSLSLDPHIRIFGNRLEIQLMNRYWQTRSIMFRNFRLSNVDIWIPWSSQISTNLQPKFIERVKNMRHTTSDFCQILWNQGYFKWLWWDLAQMRNRKISTHSLVRFRGKKKLGLIIFPFSGDIMCTKFRVGFQSNK